MNPPNPVCRFEQTKLSAQWSANFLFFKFLILNMLLRNHFCNKPPKLFQH